MIHEYTVTYIDKPSEVNYDVDYYCRKACTEAGQFFVVTEYKKFDVTFSVKSSQIIPEPIRTITVKVIYDTNKFNKPAGGRQIYPHSPE